MSKAYDPIAPWFLAAEGLGEFIGIRFGQIAPGKTEPDWTFLRHAEFDGIGGLAEILRRKGAVIDGLPQIKHPAGPSVVPLLKMAPNFVLPRYRVQLKPLEQNGVIKQTHPLGPPPAVAWHVFHEDDTARVRAHSKRAGVTVNTFLLKCLNAAVRPSLQDQAAAVPWMIPVNLRGKVVRDRDTANYSSYISVTVQQDESLHSIHKKIREALDRRDHWGNWLAYDLGRLAPHGVKKFLLAKELATSKWNLGGFSNLGDWDPGKQIREPACLGDWLFSPPVLRFQRIGAGCMTFQNRLSLLIQVHPELTKNVAVPRGWVQNWVGTITEALADGRRTI